MTRLTPRRPGGRLLAQLLAALIAAPVLIGASSLVGLGASAARAQTPSGGKKARFDARVSAALGHYRKGEFLAAIEDFEAAYALDPRPELVYNVARSYEKALRPDEAIATYARFVDLPGTTAELRTKALDALTALREEQAARARASAAARPRAEPPPSPPTPAAGVAEPRRPRGADRTLEWALLGGGVAVAGVGAVFGLLALDDEAALDEARANGAPRAELEGLADDTESKALVADVLYGVGAAAALTGIVLFLATGNDDASVVVGPTAHPEGGGISVTGRF